MSILNPNGTLVVSCTTAGNYTVTVPVWAKTVTIDMAPGGASGANGTTAASGTATSGGAGGSGGLTRHYGPISTSLLGTTISCYVGVGGVQPTGAGAQGNQGAATSAVSGNLLLAPANVAGTSSGGSTTASASGGAGGAFSAGTSAVGSTAGNVGWGSNGVSGTAGNIAVYGFAGTGGGGAVGAAGPAGSLAQGQTKGAAAGGGVSAAGVGMAGGGIFYLDTFSQIGNATAPGGNAAATYAVVWPGMSPTGGAGGAGGDATHAGGNGAMGSGPGAPGGGGGSTITGQAYGFGAAGQPGAAIFTFSP